MVDYYNDFIFDFLEQNGLNKEIRKNPAVYDFIGSIFSYEIKKLFKIVINTIFLKLK